MDYLYAKGGDLCDNREIIFGKLGEDGKFSNPLRCINNSNKWNNKQ